jgi:hypothetical protein
MASTGKVVSSKVVCARCEGINWKQSPLCQWCAAPMPRKRVELGPLNRRRVPLLLAIGDMEVDPLWRLVGRAPRR